MRGKSARHNASAALVAELLKLLRLRWATAYEVSVDMDMGIQTARGWIAELEANGLLISRRAPQGIGTRPWVYTLSSEWGGTAAVTEAA